MAAQKETAIISGKAFWTKLNRKDEYSDKYQLDVGDLSSTLNIEVSYASKNAISKVEKFGGKVNLTKTL